MKELKIIKQNKEYALPLLVMLIVLATFLIIITQWNLPISEKIQLFSVFIAIILGITSLFLSIYNNKKTLALTTKQYMLAEKIELLLNLNEDIIKIRNKKDKFTSSEKDYPTNVEYENYLLLITFQKLLNEKNNLISLLFPKTSEKYINFKFKCTENINEILNDNKYLDVLTKLFELLFEKTEMEEMESLHLLKIFNVLLVSDDYYQLKYKIKACIMNEDPVEDYYNGLNYFFNELDVVMKCFKNEFEYQKKFYLK